MHRMLGCHVQRVLREMAATVPPTLSIETLAECLHGCRNPFPHQCGSMLLGLQCITTAISLYKPTYNSMQHVTSRDATILATVKVPIGVNLDLSRLLRVFCHPARTAGAQYTPKVPFRRLAGAFRQSTPAYGVPTDSGP